MIRATTATETTRQSRATGFDCRRRRARCTAVPENAIATRALITLIGGISAQRTAMTVDTSPARVEKSSCFHSTREMYELQAADLVPRVSQNASTHRGHR